MVFSVVMYGCESWTIKKAEHRGIVAFELWCWRRLLRVPWTARRSNRSLLKEISPGCSLEGLMLKLKLQYFGHLMWRADSFEKILMLGKIEGRRRRDDRGWDGWMPSLTQWTWVWVNSRSWRWTGRPGVLQSMGSQRIGHDWVTELNLKGCRLQGWVASGQTTNREGGSPTHQQIIGLKFYWSRPCPPEQDSVFPTDSCSQQEACTSLLVSSARG